MKFYKIFLLTMLLLGFTNAYLVSKVLANPTNNFTFRICSNLENTSATYFNNSLFNFTVNGAYPGSIISSNYSQCNNTAYNNSNVSLFIQTIPQASCTVNPPAQSSAYEEQCVDFVLNSSYTNTTLNATVYSNGTLNFTNVTLNYIFVNGTRANALLMLFNESTKSFVNGAPIFTNTNGIYAEHCLGLLNTTTKVCLPNKCAFTGNSASFGGGQQGGQSTPTTACTVNGSSLYFFDFANYASGIVTTPNLLSNAVAGPTFNDITVAMINLDSFFFETRSASNQQPPTMYSSNLSGYQILNYSNQSQILFNSSGTFGPPAFLTPDTLYVINLTYTNSSTTYNYQYPFLPLGKGMGGAVIQATSLTPDSTFFSRLVNETGSPVVNAVVYAQTFQGFARPDGVTFVNSSVTDSNGLFTLKVPGGTYYKFLIVSGNKDSTNGGYLYFPTLNDNGNRGFQATSGKTVVLPNFILKKGATLNTNITLNGAGGIAIELFQYLDLPYAPTKVSYTSKMLPVNMFQDTTTVPSYVNVPYISPVGSVSESVYGFASLFDTSGRPPTVNSVCFNTTSITTQGSVYNISCTINASVGTLNLSVNNCNSGSVFNCTTSIGDPSFLFDSKLVIKNQSSGNIVGVIDDGTFLTSQVSFRTQSSVNGNLKLILPLGNYTIAAYPKFTDTKNPVGFIYSSNITINNASVTNLTISRQNPSWGLFSQFPLSSTTTQTQTYRVSVIDFGNGAPTLLNNTKVNVTIQVLQLNGSYAGNMSNPLNMTFNASNSIPVPINASGTFEVNFTPSLYAINASKYYILIRANASVNGVTYFTQQKLFLSVSDFITGIDLSKTTYGTSDNLTAVLFTYNNTLNPPTPLNTTVNLTFYKDGFLLSSLAVNTTNGLGNFTQSLSSLNIVSPGLYEVLASASVASSTNTGFADKVFQVSNLLATISYDKTNYKPTDSVVVTLTVQNSTGSALTNASVQAAVDNSQIITQNYTDSNGKTTLTLNPTTILNSNWSFGYRAVNFKISKDLSTSVLFQEIPSGFQVNGFNVFFGTEKKTYGTSEAVRLIFGGSFSGTPNIYVDGVQFNGNLQQTGAGFSIMSISPNPTWTSGSHTVKASFQKGSDSQDFFTSFESKGSDASFSLNQSSYNVGSPILLIVTLFNSTTGQPINGTLVNATVFKAQGTTDVAELQSNVNTSANGSAAITLNASTSGFHYIKIATSDLTRFVGFYVSEASLTISSTLDKSSYSPGDQVSLTINSSAGVNSTVDAKIWVQGFAQSLPSATLNSSNITIINFTIPGDAPASSYFIEVKVSSPTGSVGFASNVLTISGRKLVLTPSRASRIYSSTESVNLTATFFESNNTVVSNIPLTLTLTQAGGTPTTVATGTTDSNGKAVFTITSGNFSSDGDYLANVYVTASPSVTAFTGFKISSIKVSMKLNVSSANLGDIVLVSFNVTNATSGSNLTPTSVVLNVFGKQKGSFSIPLTVSGSQPYTTTLTIPSDSSALGFYNLVLVAAVNGSSGSSSGGLSVTNTSATLTLTVPSSVTSGSPFLVNFTAGSGNGNATINIFSPGNPLAYSTTVALAGGFNSTNVTNVTTPGTYIVSIDTPVGSIFKQVNVLPSSALLFYSSFVNGTNSTVFASGTNIVISSSLANTSAVFLTNAGNTTSTTVLPLALNSSSGLYSGTFTPSTSGFYLARLDTSTSSGLTSFLLKIN